MTVNQQVTRSIFRENRFANAGLSIGMGLSLFLGACGKSDAPSTGNPQGAGSNKDVTITLVGYAVPKAAHDVIIQKFVAK